ncbi:MAG: hypothetical protein Q7T96_19895 [Methylobacter sp.]|nr:hypothetical protein [Methylobacter sp.]
MKVVNKSDLIAAHNSKQLLDPAISDLKKIDVQAVGHDPYALEKITAFISWLQKFEAKEDGVISQAQSQHDNRPQHLITAASIRLCSIPEAIKLEQKTIEHKTSAYQTKSDELKKKGFSSAEINNILPCPQSELDVHANNITNLKAEQKNIEAFLGGAPAYDTSLLDMEKLAPFLQHHNQAE